MASATTLVILNPAAHRGKMHRHRKLVQHRADQAGAEYVETKMRGDARKLAQQAATDGRPVIIVGGDGSVHEVINGLLSAGGTQPLGIVPAGTGNDFAWNNLKLPRDPAAAIERAFTGTPISVDAGIANDQYFANSFSVGLDADIAKVAERMKRLPFMQGATLYYTTSLRQLFFGYSKCPWLNVTIDGQSGEGVQRHVLVAVTNGPTYGGGFRINPQADPADGLFDVCAIRYIPRMRALTLLPVVKKGEHASEPEVAFHHARTVRIECPNGVNAQMDGETMSATTYDVRVLPGALLVRV